MHILSSVLPGAAETQGWTQTADSTGWICSKCLIERKGQLTGGQAGNKNPNYQVNQVQEVKAVSRNLIKEFQAVRDKDGGEKRTTTGSERSAPNETMLGHTRDCSAHPNTSL